MKFHHRFLTFFFIVCLLLSACGNVAGSDISQTATPGTELTPIALESGYGVSGQWFDLYFTNPSSPPSSEGTGGVDGPIVEAIDAARLSVDVAAYSLNLSNVRRALLRAHDRGVTVRLVMESDNMDRSDPQMLIQAGIPIVGDNLPSSMHNKFIVLDKSEVWLGSMDFTDADAHQDNNNLMRIRSIKVAEDYVTEFEEMFTSKLFGPYVVPQTPNPTVTIGATRVDIYFSPDDGVLNALDRLLNSAQKSIYFLAYSFTSKKLGDTMRAKAQTGLRVEGVMDEEQIKSNQGTQFNPFRQAGLDVRIAGNAGQMHHKVLIIDENIVAFGSYDFSRNAETQNDENLIIVHDADIAQQFMQEFQRVWAQAHQ